ncbi:DNA binding domain, excisionase family [Mycobacteroides abscessus subsp. abscessus]|uniref:helix-turn-helix domain-containing protein n=1 Tax=Mycobacteroides abscessus TaxID=36809 RepID=UPI0009293737|nr:helix-turn-helix domain-containing protein [Mycobacteroides abscessus]SHR99356.1 DNA binding domain, excisionase family [Mycobacteroides abscessus subsp. abscessus]SHX68464.1 DNA binding domain, excisionase family [Mycobacteroides abscessus subsp. abscessus]SIC57971.1 DNA binding domain, excisionase family [Mycobacteroides abscessus subsp. abscessus]SKK19399.1 DNA binding domain, excisionase family [Mycobacteroides abscessus subsp. abscessus]SKP48972.1 DNA binding domain, excisionase family
MSEQENTVTVPANPAFEPNPDEFLRTDAIAEELDLCTETVRRMIRDHRLRAVRLKGEYRVRRRWLDEYLDSTLVGA